MPKPKVHDYKKLAEAYKNGIPMADIREEFGCTNKTIHQAVLDQGGKIDRTGKITVEEVNKLLAKPMKVSEISQILDSERRTVLSFLTRNDFPFTTKEGDKRKTKYFERKV